jgi:hypothetical protein
VLGTTVAAAATITSLGSIQLLALPLFTSLLVYPARISFAHQTCLSPCSLPTTPHRIEATQMQRISLLQFLHRCQFEQHHLAQLPPFVVVILEMSILTKPITELPQVYSMNTFSVQQKLARYHCKVQEDQNGRDRPNERSEEGGRIGGGGSAYAVFFMLYPLSLYLTTARA